MCVCVCARARARMRVCVRERELERGRESVIIIESMKSLFFMCWNCRAKPHTRHSQECFQEEKSI